MVPKTFVLSINFLRLQITELLTFDPVAMITPFPRQQGVLGIFGLNKHLNIKSIVIYCAVYNYWNILRTLILTGANLAMF